MKKAKEFIAPLIESTSIFQDGLNLSTRDVYKTIEISYLEGLIDGENDMTGIFETDKFKSKDEVLGRLYELLNK